MIRYCCRLRRVAGCLLIAFSLSGPLLCAVGGRAEEHGEARQGVADNLTREMASDRLASGIAADQSLENFDASLRMKEEVDFLLTPALLVQEVLQGGVVVTYPME